jgi:hypothetical protein
MAVGELAGRRRGQPRWGSRWGQAAPGAGANGVTREKNLAKFQRKIRNIAIIGESRKKSRIAQIFQPNLDYAPDHAPKDPRRPFPPCSPKYTPNNPHETLNPLIFPQIDRNSKHYCAVQARSTHHQHQLCCKFVTCYMLFLFLRDSFTKVLSKSF